MKRVYLHITSWIGVSVGAQHYYAQLQDDTDYDRRIDLTRILTPAQAARANRDSFFRVKAGQESKGFDSQDEIRTLAVKVWQEYFPDGDILLEGDWGTAEPLRILVWPKHPELIDEANRVWSQFEKISGYQYEKNLDAADRLTEMWESILDLKISNERGKG